MNAYRNFISLLFVIVLGANLQACGAAPMSVPIYDAEQALGSLAPEIRNAIQGVGDVVRVRSMVDPSYISLGWWQDGTLKVVLLNIPKQIAVNWDDVLGTDGLNMRSFLSWTKVMQFTEVSQADVKEALFTGAVIGKNWLAEYTSIELMPVLTLAGAQDLPYQFLPSAGEVR